MQTIVWFYSCSECGIRKRAVDVAARTPEQNVVTWMHEVCAVAIAHDHSATSPTCRATHMRDLMIPLTGVERIGDAPVN